MRAFDFSEDTVAEIRHDRYHHPHPRVQRKMEVLCLKSRGLAHADIAELADVSLRSVQRYLDEFAQGGLDRVRRLNWQGQACELDEHQPSLEDYFIEHPPRSAREAQEAIERLSNHAYINAESVCALLRQVAAAGLRGPITLVLDNARYQKCAVVKALAASLGVELLYLPSYSPNLNLIERLWKFVKKECLGCRVLPTYEAFTAAIDDCLANLNTRHKQQMASLLTLEFQLFDDDMPVLAA